MGPDYDGLLVLYICDNKYLAIFALYDNRRDNDNLASWIIPLTGQKCIVKDYGFKDSKWDILYGVTLRIHCIA